jgi:hypothetical protein
VRPLLVIAAGACAGLTLAGCSIAYSLNGLTGGSESSDGASPTTDSSSPDVAMVDAPAADEGAAASEGSSTAEAGAEAAAPLFSDNFEGTQALPRGWDNMYQMGGSVELEHTVSLSQDTTGFEATSLALPANAATDAVNLSLRKNVTLPTTGLTAVYDFYVYPEEYDTEKTDPANAVIGQMQLSDAAGDLFQLQVDGTYEDGALAVNLGEYTALASGSSPPYLGPTVSGVLQPSTWSEVRLELTFAQPPVARVYLNGTLGLTTAVTMTFAATALQISLGLSYVRPNSGAWNIYYDDVYYEVSQQY